MIPVNNLRVPVKSTVNALEASCQLFYRKIYGVVYSVYGKISTAYRVDKMGMKTERFLISPQKKYAVDTHWKSHCMRVYSKNTMATKL